MLKHFQKIVSKSMLQKNLHFIQNSLYCLQNIWYTYSLNISGKVSTARPLSFLIRFENTIFDKSAIIPDIFVDPM